MKRLTKDINGELTILKSKETSYTCIDLYMSIGEGVVYIGSINDIQEINLDSNGTARVRTKGNPIASILHNVKEVQQKRYSEGITTIELTITNSIM